MTEPPLAAGHRRAVVKARIERVRELCGESGAFIRSRRNVAWLTLGADAHVVDTTDDASLAIVITRDGCQMLTTTIEERRLRDEELAGLAAPTAVPWETPLRAAALEIAGSDLIDDVALEDALRVERARLDRTERDRVRWLGPRAAAAVLAVAGATSPGETEAAIAAEIRRALAAVTVAAPLVLVAADDRIARYRHPLPTSRPVERTLMLVLVAERWGLHVALTRMVSFGSASEELARRHAAARGVEQAIHGATRIGRTLGETLADGIAAYASQGYAEEWRLHHQGGTIAYRGREIVATREETALVEAGAAFAWNPSITGAKVEDTFLLCADGRRETVTRDARWPSDPDGAPLILER